MPLWLPSRATRARFPSRRSTCGGAHSKHLRCKRHRDSLGHLSGAGREAALGHDCAGAVDAWPLQSFLSFPGPSALQEKDKFEEEEADDLINFVEGLNFDKYAGALQWNVDSTCHVAVRPDQIQEQS